MAWPLLFVLSPSVLSSFALTLNLFYTTFPCVRVPYQFAIEIPDADAEKILSTEDAIKYILQHPHAK